MRPCSHMDWCPLAPLSTETNEVCFDSIDVAGRNGGWWIDALADERNDR